MKNKLEAICPGSKIKSKGKGRGMGTGKGEGPVGVPIKEKEKMEKKSYLEEVYNSTFKDELKKIAYESVGSARRKVIKAEKHLRRAKSDKQFAKNISESEKKYVKDMMPYKKERNLVRGGGLLGAVAGGLVGFPFPRKGRGLKTALGILAGGTLGTATTHHGIGYLKPEYKKSFNKAIEDLINTQEKAAKKRG